MDQIDALFSDYDDTTPGCAVTVLDGDETIIRTYGLADLERRVPIGPGTRFNLGSASKQFTALAVLLLADEGGLSLDDGLRTGTFTSPMTLTVVVVSRSLTWVTAPSSEFSTGTTPRSR